jgi:hypothetical protein
LNVNLEFILTPSTRQPLRDVTSLDHSQSSSAAISASVGAFPSDTSYCLMTASIPLTKHPSAFPQIPA